MNTDEQYYEIIDCMLKGDMALKSLNLSSDIKKKLLLEMIGKDLLKEIRKKLSSGSTIIHYTVTQEGRDYHNNFKK